MLNLIFANTNTRFTDVKIRSRASYGLGLNPRRPLVELTLLTDSDFNDLIFTMVWVLVSRQSRVRTCQGEGQVLFTLIPALVPKNQLRT